MTCKDSKMLLNGGMKFEKSVPVDNDFILTDFIARVFNQAAIDFFFVECNYCGDLIHKFSICECCLINGTGYEQPLGIIKAFKEHNDKS